MPGLATPQAPLWGLPPYPALGWNEAQVQQQQHNVAPQGVARDGVAQDDIALVDDGWAAWNIEEAGDNGEINQEVMPAQDQNSMVLNPSLNSGSSSDSDVVEVQMPPVVPVQQEDPDQDD